MSEIIRKEKLSNQVCNLIQEKIFAGEYKDGERLVETKVARELGVSQSPVREALRELEVMGLVEIKPYSGCFVRTVDAARLRQIYSLRSMLEKHAVKEGLQNITDRDVDHMEQILDQMRDDAKKDDRKKVIEGDLQFHHIFVEAADNPMLSRMWELVGASRWSEMVISSHDDPMFFPESHVKLLEYVKERNTDALYQEFDKHFRTAADIVMDGKVKKHKKNN